MNPVILTILIEPVAKGRPRLAVVKGHARAYTPAKTRDAEEYIRWSIRNSGVGLIPKPCAVALTVTFYRPRPSGVRKSITLPITKPDITNYLKLLEDAMNKYIYEDDSQITKICATKRFAQTGTVPRIEIEITEDLG